jgi:hypothetical protein
MHGLITEDWGDGTYQFRLGYGQWLELDQLLQVGPLALYARLLNRQWKANDLREIVRLGLIGGGCEPLKALRLVKNYVEDRPLLESVPFALKIMEAGLIVPDGARKPGEAGAAPSDATNASTSQPPTETLQ